MAITFQDRLLIHGPRLHDLTDFLFFDKIVYPTALAYVRPAGVPPGVAGYKLTEPVDRDIQERLRMAGLIVSPASLLPKIDFLESSPDEVGRWRKEMKEMTSTALRVLDLPPDTSAEQQAIDKFLIEIDTSTRHLSELAMRYGKNAVAKYYTQSVGSVLTPGNQSVLSIVYSKFPTIDLSHIGISEFIDFLSDEETKKMRRRLFNWQNGIETAIEKGNIKIEHVPDRIATLLDDYTTWIKSSGLTSKISAAETLLTLSEAFIEALTLVGIPKAIKTILDFGKRKIELNKAELNAPGREVAFIVHCQRKFEYK